LQILNKLFTIEHTNLRFCFGLTIDTMHFKSVHQTFALSIAVELSLRVRSNIFEVSSVRSTEIVSKRVPRSLFCFSTTTRRSKAVWKNSTASHKIVSFVWCFTKYEITSIHMGVLMPVARCIFSNSALLPLVYMFMFET
jgi:hypothetical protein